MSLQASIQTGTARRGTATATLPPGAGVVDTGLHDFLAFKLVGHGG